jgi:dephospho-CoA kinase
MKLVALTGGIATGKSTVAKMFQELGAIVLQADGLAHRTYLRGTPVYREILRRYGPKILNRARNIDRKKLADILFNSPKEKKWLESKIHPATLWLLGEKLRQAIARRPKLILVEAALHFETGYYRFFPVTCVVYAGTKDQVDRLILREGLSASEALLRLKNQMPMALKRKLADFMLDNSGSLKNTRRQVKTLFNMWTRS